MIRASLQWIFLITGTMVGAGYASGRELWEFFGQESEVAIFLFFILFSLSCCAIMTVSYKQQAKHYIPVLEKIIGHQFLRIFDILLLLYLFLMTIVMIAGSGAAGEIFNLPKGWGIFFISITIGIIFVRNLHSVIHLNQMVIPLLMVGLLTVLFIFIKKQNISFGFRWDQQKNWLSAFPFTALNILPLTAVLGAIGYKIKSKAEIYIACIGSSLILGGISFIYNRSLIHVQDVIDLYEIPLFAIINNFPLSIHIFMTFLLWIAIYTTAASGMMGMISRIKNYFKLPIWQITIILLIAMIPFSLVGFSSLIHYVYPFFGVLNLYVLIKLLLYPLWNFS